VRKDVMGENKQGDGDEAKSESKKGVIFFFVCLLLVGAGFLVARGGSQARRPYRMSRWNPQ
jgi:hypothetical protein